MGSPAPSTIEIGCVCQWLDNFNFSRIYIYIYIYILGIYQDPSEGRHKWANLPQIMRGPRIGKLAKHGAILCDATQLSTGGSVASCVIGDKLSFIQFIVDLTNPQRMMGWLESPLFGLKALITSKGSEIICQVDDFQDFWIQSGVGHKN